MSHLHRVAVPCVLLALTTFALPACGDDADEREGPARTEEAAPEDSERTNTVTETVVEVLPGAGITGVGVGDSREDVVAALGEPARTESVPNEFSGGENERLEYDGPKVALLMQEFDGGTELLQVEVTDPSLRTITGDISIGSTEEQLLGAFPAARCDTGKLHLCRLGRERAGDIVTDFFVEDGEVSRIVVGRILD